MPKIPIKEFDKDLICLGCGWHGTLGETRGPNEERSFVLDEYDHLWWAVFYNYYCPDCFKEQEAQAGVNTYTNEGFKKLPGGALQDNKGTIVRRDMVGQGRVSDAELSRIRNMNIEETRKKLRAAGKIK